MADKFNVIVVGGGVAGCVTALMLAREGLEVVLVERGNYSGAKNMTGGRLYSYSLERVIPDFASVAPVERRVVRERISMMTEKSATTIEYLSDALKQNGSDSYTVLRASFDRWLCQQAEAAGAMHIAGMLVEDLIINDGKVCGIIAGGDEILADVVVLADGANSQLMERAGLRTKPIKPSEIAVGVKELIELGAKTIEDRFNVASGEGLSWLCAGYPSGGKIGGGLIYTNKDSISIGVVVTLSEFNETELSINDMLENFKRHSVIAPLINGGKLLEYSGHLVAEAGFSALAKPSGSGVLAVGDAAGFVMNLGYTIRGMDLAVSSAIAAAKTIVAARDNLSDINALDGYKGNLEAEGVLADMKHYSNFPSFMENHRIFGEYPEMIDGLLADLFVMNGSKPRSLVSKLLSAANKVGVLNIVGDAIKGVRSL
ncbi:FAD-dependent oxidoreductase [Deferribacterales bacterium RsTz2092]|nr:oxidoreductase FixC [Deferribacterales bacterium]